MDVRNVAAKAYKLFQCAGNECKTMHQTALAGFFKGIADGAITIGQEWPINILLNDTTIDSVEDFKLIEQVFSSGMLCQGQQLTLTRGR